MNDPMLAIDESTFIEHFAPPDFGNPFFRVVVWKKIGEGIVSSDGRTAPRVQYHHTEYLSPEDPRVQAWVKTHCNSDEAV